MANKSFMKIIDGVEYDNLRRLMWYRFLNVFSVILILVSIVIASYVYHMKVHSVVELNYNCTAAEYMIRDTASYNMNNLENIKLIGALAYKCVASGYVAKDICKNVSNKNEDYYKRCFPDTVSLKFRLNYRYWSTAQLISFMKIPVVILIGAVLMVIFLRRATIYVKRG